MAKTIVETSSSSNSRSSSRAATEFADLERIVKAGAATYEQLMRYQKLGPGLGKGTSWINEGHVTRARARSAQRDLAANNIARSNSSSGSSSNARVIVESDPVPTPTPAPAPAPNTTAGALGYMGQGINIVNQIIGGGEGDRKPDPDLDPDPDPNPYPDPDPNPKPGPGGDPGGEDITSKMNPLDFVKGSLPGLNWLPMAMAPLSMLGAFGKDPVFDRLETSHTWRKDFKNEFKGISEDARTDPYEGKFFRNANRAALTSTNVMLANDAATTEKQRLAGGQLFAGGQQRALGQAAAGFYANQGNLLSEGYRIRDRAANMENDYVNHNTDKNQELFQFEVEQGTHAAYGRGMNLVNRVVSAGMAGAGMGLDMTGKLFDLTTKKALAEQSLGHYTGGGGEVTINPDPEPGAGGAGGGTPWRIGGLGEQRRNVPFDQNIPDPVELTPINPDLAGRGIQTPVGLNDVPPMYAPPSKFSMQENFPQFTNVPDPPGMFGKYGNKRRF